MTVAVPYRLTEITCSRAECLSPREQGRPLCYACRRWPGNHQGEERPASEIKKTNSKQLGGPPTAASLGRDIASVSRLRSIYLPSLHEELGRRYEISTDRDGYASGSRHFERVNRGGANSPTDEAALALIAGRRDTDDPQGVALGKIADALRDLEKVGLQIEETGWGPILYLDLGLKEGHWLREQSDPRILSLPVVVPLIASDRKKNQMLVRFWEMDAGCGPSFRQYVNGVRAGGRLAREIIARINDIENVTGQRLLEK